MLHEPRAIVRLPEEEALAWESMQATMASRHDGRALRWPTGKRSTKRSVVGQELVDARYGADLRPENAKRGSGRVCAGPSAEHAL